jgi:hypothetical protein
MKKLALITAFVLVTGCAALDPTPEATGSATPSITAEDVQKAVDDALTKAFAVNRENAVDVEATIDDAVEKAITRTVHDLKPIEAKSDQAEPLKEAEPIATARQVVEKVGITRLQTVHPTVSLKREIRDCTLELLMFDTHVVDAADACLRIYRSQYRRHPSRADGSVPTTMVHQ